MRSPRALDAATPRLLRPLFGTASGYRHTEAGIAAIVDVNPGLRRDGDTFLTFPARLNSEDLLNAHASNGQQFDWVFIPGLDENHLPCRRNSTGEVVDAGKRVLLIMLSGARHGVLVTTATALDGVCGPYRSKPSRWWDLFANAASMDVTALKTHLDPLYPSSTWSPIVTS